MYISIEKNRLQAWVYQLNGCVVVDTSVLIHYCSFWCVGALIRAVQYTVAIAVFVNRASVFVHFGSFQSIRAFVEIIGDSVSVRINGATMFVNFNPLGSVGAFVVMVNYTVVIRIECTTFFI